MYQVLKWVNPDNYDQSDYTNDDTDLRDQFGGKYSNQEHKKKKNLLLGLYDIIEWLCKDLLSIFIPQY